jgi:hypothetical protein
MRHLALPVSREALTFSADVRRLPGEDPWRWEGVLRVAGRALGAGAEAGVLASAWVACLPWRDRKHVDTELITLSIATDQALTREQVAALCQPIRRVGRIWSLDGVVTVPTEAFPVLASAPEIYRLWRHDKTGPHRLAVQTLGPPSRTIRLGPDDPPDGPEEFADAIADTGTDAGLVFERNRLKLAFATAVARDIVGSDNILDEREITFLTEHYGEKARSKYGIDDEPALAEAVAEAEERLATLLGHHEKLALLSVFFGVCWADGNIDVRELRALRDASQRLGLEPQETASYLLKVR